MHKFTEKEILKMLKKFFGFTQFKGRQLEIIKAYIRGDGATIPTNTNTKEVGATVTLDWGGGGGTYNPEI